jgi:hypothetical protein
LTEAFEIRTWFVPLSILDDNRLVAQHRELHTIFGSVMSPHPQGYRNHPAVKEYLGEHLSCALSYHAATLVEMTRRGWTGHKTPISEALASVAATRSGTATCKDWAAHIQQMDQARLWADVHDLIPRWTKEGKYLRNAQAALYVEIHLAHCLVCNDAGNKLLREFDYRGVGVIPRGNSSLRFAMK